MSFDIIIELYDRVPTELQTVFIIVVLFLGYKKVIKLPFIKYGNKETHESCNLYADMNNIIAKAIEKSQKIVRIKTIETLYEQMSMLEVVQESIMYLMRSAYRGLCVNEKDISHYEHILKVAERETKNLIRKWFRENHFTSRTEQEFSIYVDEKIEFLIEKVTIILNETYKDEHFTIPRLKVFEKNMNEVVPKVKAKWRDAFYRAREISRVSENRMEGLGN